MKTVTIPNDYHPFEVEVNGRKYRYPEGTEQSVPDEVADIIDNYWELQPKQAKAVDGGMLPYVTEANDGDVLKVKDGAWSAGKDETGGGSTDEPLFKGRVATGEEVNVPVFYPEAADIYLDGTLADLSYEYDSETEEETYAAYTRNAELMIYPSTEVENTLVICANADIEVEIRVKPKGSTVMVEVLSQSDAYTRVRNLSSYNFMYLLANYNLRAHIYREGSQSWGYYGEVHGGMNRRTNETYMATTVDNKINIVAWSFDFDNGSITATIGGDS